MKILTVDIGTGTQDIFLYDSNLDIENGFKLVLPSPTMMIHRRVKQCYSTRTPILFTGIKWEVVLQPGRSKNMPRAGDSRLYDRLRRNDTQ